MAAQALEADGYVDNSPLRSELTTYPQPLLPGQLKEEEGYTAQSHIDVGYPQAAAGGFILKESTLQLDTHG